MFSRPLLSWDHGERHMVSTNWLAESTKSIAVQREEGIFRIGPKPVAKGLQKAPILGRGG